MTSVLESFSIRVFASPVIDGKYMTFGMQKSDGPSANNLPGSNASLSKSEVSAALMVISICGLPIADNVDLVAVNLRRRPWADAPFDVRFNNIRSSDK